MEKLVKRKKIFIWVNCAIGCFVVLIPIIILALGIWHMSFFVIGMFILVAWFFAAFGYYHVKISIPYKTEVIGPILKKLSPTLTYNYKEDGTIYRDLIKKNKLIPPASSFQFTDFIHDKIEDIPYTSVDLCASHTQGSGKSSHTVIDFRGKIYDVVLGKTYCNYILKEEGWKKVPEGYELLDLEVIAFNNKFDLYTTDSLEIYKIFTPKRIEDCRNIEFFQDRKSMICHIEDHLYIFLSNRENQFEGMPTEEIIKKQYLTQLGYLNKYLSIFKD